MMRQVLDDIRFYASTGNPGRKPSVLRSLSVPLSRRGFWLLLGHRSCSYVVQRRNRCSPIWWLIRVAEVFIRYANVVINKSETAADCAIPGPVYFASRGHFIIGAMGIGTGTVIQRQVTLGEAVGVEGQKRPTIGANVWIGQGCVIAGGITIGDGSTILADSYVTTDVPPRAVVCGNPARVIRRQFDNTACLRNPETAGVPRGLEV